MDRRVEWRVCTPRQRRVQQIGIIVLLLVFLWTLTFDDVDGVLRVANVLVLAVVLAQVVSGRARTVADVDGVEVCGGVRTRHVPWSTVEEVHAVRSQVEDPKVVLHLTDGSTRTLPCVGADDVPRLEELRTLAQE